MNFIVSPCHLPPQNENHWARAGNRMARPEMKEDQVTGLKQKGQEIDSESNVRLEIRRQGRRKAQ